MTTLPTLREKTPAGFKRFTIRLVSGAGQKLSFRILASDRAHAERLTAECWPGYTAIRAEG